MKNNRDFDFLSVCIVLMGLLTALTGVVSCVLFTKLRNESKAVRSSIRRLNDMKMLAKDEKFKGWIQKEQKGKLEKRTASSFLQKH